MKWCPIRFCPPVIAHRGACAYAPENTLSAFEKAAALGVKWIEFDVNAASCGEPVIIHDGTLKRTTTGKGRVSEKPLSYLKTLDAGRWFDKAFAGQTVPTLAETLEWLVDMQMNANVEIKTSPIYEKTLVKRISDIVSPYLKEKKTNLLFSSFSWPALYTCRELLPDAQMGLLMHSMKKNWQKVAEELNCQTIHVNERLLSTKNIAHLRSFEKPLLAYTVNTVERALFLYEQGVEALFTDVPDVIQQAYQGFSKKHLG